jgi:hypothetical protein
MIITRRISLLAATAVVVAGAATAPIAWSSTPHGDQQIALTWTVAFTTQDLPPSGASSGDTLQAHFTLTGKTKGTADFACTAVVENYLCQGIIRLRNGDLYAHSGPVDESQPAAIVGGTRAYDGARGQFTQVELSEQTGTWTISLQH